MTQRQARGQEGAADNMAEVQVAELVCESHDPQALGAQAQARQADRQTREDDARYNKNAAQQHHNHKST